MPAGILQPLLPSLTFSLKSCMISGVINYGLSRAGSLKTMYSSYNYRQVT